MNIGQVQRIIGVSVGLVIAAGTVLASPEVDQYLILLAERITRLESDWSAIRSANPNDPELKVINEQKERLIALQKKRLNRGGDLIQRLTNRHDELKTRRDQLAAQHVDGHWSIDLLDWAMADINDDIRTDIGSGAGLVGECFVMGHVAMPGVYDLSDNAMTVNQLVIIAGGLSPEAAGGLMIIRRKPDGTEANLLMPLEAFGSPDWPSPLVRPDDQVRVGVNWPATRPAKPGDAGM
jgi:hypothetical protein